ncbi:MAG: PilZ domain-containing protein [Candidatus Eremiobacteraeota bacterium]|nr:PilZ domain-containing protein [Candidatus Eremiobacteraeota bacterium]
MLPELLAWFTGKEQNRRKFPRKRKPYRAAYSLDGKTTHAAIGLDIGGGGLCILTQEPIKRDEFEVRVVLDERNLRMRAKVVWHDNVQHQGRKVWRYGMRFTGIPADDWDAIIRYTTDRPVTEANKAQDELAAVRMTPDDTARLLPKELQTRLLQMLVERRRLAPLDERVTPLVQYFYSGIVRHNDRLVHRLVIQSKVVGPERDELFETRFVFDESGKNVQILN